MENTYDWSDDSSKGILNYKPFLTSPVTDFSQPSIPVVTDDTDYTVSTSELHASWSAVDPESSIIEYQYAIGTFPREADTVKWVSVGTNTSLIHSGLSLTPEITYYFSVKAKNGQGVWSEVGVSDGITVWPAPKFLTLPFNDPDIKIQQGWRYNAPIGPDSTDPYAHNGIDYIKGKLDQPPWQSFDVITAGDGLAMQSSGGGYGTFVLIKHNETDYIGNNYFTLYAHLNNVTPSIVSKTRWDTDYESWSTVKQGEIIGIAGATGVEEHPDWIHLHFEVQRGGYAQNKTDPYGLYTTRDNYPGNGNYISSGLNYLWITDPPVPSTPPLTTTTVSSTSIVSSSLTTPSETPGWTISIILLAFIVILSKSRLKRL